MIALLTGFEGRNVLPHKLGMLHNCIFSALGVWPSAHCGRPSSKNEKSPRSLTPTVSVIVMGEVGLLNHVDFVIEPSRAPRPGCALFDLLPGSSLAGLAAARILSRLPLLLCYDRLLTLEGCCSPKILRNSNDNTNDQKRALRYDYESKQKRHLRYVGLSSSGT